MKRAVSYIISLLLLLQTAIITTPTHAAEITGKFQTISLGSGHSAAIKTDGSLWTWGANNNGQFGDGTTTDKHTPVKIMDNIKLPTASPENTQSPRK